MTSDGGNKVVHEYRLDEGGYVQDADLADKQRPLEREAVLMSRVGGARRSLARCVPGYDGQTEIDEYACCLHARSRRFASPQSIAQGMPVSGCERERSDVRFVKGNF